MDVILALTAVVGAFYFILLRPVINQQRRQRRDISSLEIGDEVLTTGGIYATVTGIETPDEGPTQLTLLVAPGVAIARPFHVVHYGDGAQAIQPGHYFRDRQRAA